MLNVSVGIASSLVLLAIPNAARAQDTQRQPVETYRLSLSIPVYECRLNGHRLPSVDTIASPPGAQFYRLYDRTVEHGDGAARVVVVMQFLDWRGENQAQLFQTFNALSTQDTLARKTFCADKEHVDRVAVRTYARGWRSKEFAAGMLILPIKMRLGGDGRPFDFSRDVTLGTVVGSRWRLSPTGESYFSVLGGVGITAVALTPENTGGKIPGVTDRAAVTLAAGLLLEFNRFQIGVLLGRDMISNPNQDDWIYHRAPWLSVGLGFSLLSAPANTPAKEQTGG